MATFVGGMQTRGPAGLTNANIDTMLANGSTLVRISQDFASMAPTSTGITNWANEAQVDYALSKGMIVVLVPTYNPSWIGAYHQIPQNSTQRGQWKALAAQLVAHYQSRAGTGADPLIAYEIWNEINHGPFNFTPSLATIRPFYKDTILAMRVIDADSFIITSGPASATSSTTAYENRWDQDAAAPGIVPTGTSASTGNGGGSISIATLLDGLFGPPGVSPDGTGIVPGTTNGTAWVSAYGIHAYTGVYDPLLVHFGQPIYHAFSDVPNHGTTAYNYWDDIIFAREGNADKVIWQTEAGFHGGSGASTGAPLTETDAANFMYTALTRWKGKQDEGKAGPYIYFELFDNKDYGDPSAGSEDYLGMYRRGFVTGKPQLTTWKSFTQPFVPPPPIDPTDPPLPGDVLFGGDTRTFGDLFGPTGADATFADYGAPLVVLPPPDEPPPDEDPTNPPPPPTTGFLWAASLNGVTITTNPAGPYVFEEESPDLFGWNSMRESDEPSPSDHGSISVNPDLLPALDKDIPFIVLADTEQECLADWKLLATAWAPSTHIQVMHLSTPDGAYELFGRPRRLGKPNLKNVGEGVITSVARYVATDPRWYSEPHTITGTVANTGSGLGLPHGFPHAFGIANAGGVTVTNDGNAPSRRIIAIVTAGVGGLVNPRLSLISTGEHLLFNLTLLQGQALWIDFQARTVKLDNTASRGGSLVRPESTFFSLPPGVSDVALGGTGAATVTVTHRSASIF